MALYNPLKFNMTFPEVIFVPPHVMLWNLGMFQLPLRYLDCGFRR